MHLTVLYCITTTFWKVNQAAACLGLADTVCSTVLPGLPQAVVLHASVQNAVTACGAGKRSYMNLDTNCHGDAEHSPCATFYVAESCHSTNKTQQSSSCT